MGRCVPPLLLLAVTQSHSEYVIKLSSLHHMQEMDEGEVEKEEEMQLQIKYLSEHA